MPNDLDDPFGRPPPTGKTALPEPSIPPPPLPPARGASIYDSVRNRWGEKGINLINTFLSIVVATSAVSGGVWAWMDGFSTDNERKAAEKVTHGEIAKLDKRLKALEQEKLRLTRELRRLDEEVTEMYRLQTGAKAAERETDVRLKAAAAAFYREEYTRLVRAGKAPSQAFREALRTTWYDRPRLRRVR